MVSPVLPQQKLSRREKETETVTSSQSSQLAATVFFLLSLVLVFACTWLLWRVWGLAREVRELRAVESQRRLSLIAPSGTAQSEDTVIASTDEASLNIATKSVVVSPTPDILTKLPGDWEKFAFPDVRLTMFAPPGYHSDLQLFDTKEYLIRFWQGADMGGAKITVVIKPNWNGLEEFKDKPRTIRLNRGIFAAKIDPPTKEKQTQEHYQTSYVFEYNSKVYQMICVHDWQAALVSQCKSMIETTELGG